MRIPFLSIAVIVLGSSAWAQHEDNHTYIQFGLGFVTSEDAEDVPGGTIEFDPGFAVDLAVGYEIFLGTKYLSIAPEFELYYQSFSVDEDDIGAIPSAVEDDAKSFALMLNGVLEWHITKQFSWYGSAGVGWADVIEYSAWDSGNLVIDDDSGFAWQGRFGFGYNLGGTYDFRAGVRYFHTEPIDIEDQITGSTDELDVGQFSVEAAVRWGV
jgi:opacity protein-like surface antigen